MRENFCTKKEKKRKKNINAVNHGCFHLIGTHLVLARGKLIGPHGTMVLRRTSNAEIPGSIPGVGIGNLKRYIHLLLPFWSCFFFRNFYFRFRRAKRFAGVPRGYQKINFSLLA
ncbi:hypothetical protein F4811DRAFT_82076 [Daldinia bambusicola]|nr:hypothetical protein F4811DRAFT_82076 [Daldinia bambusicola]